MKGGKGKGEARLLRQFRREERRLLSHQRIHGYGKDGAGFTPIPPNFLFLPLPPPKKKKKKEKKRNSYGRMTTCVPDLLQLAPHILERSGSSVVRSPRLAAGEWHHQGIPRTNKDSLSPRDVSSSSRARPRQEGEQLLDNPVRFQRSDFGGGAGEICLKRGFG